MDLLRKPSRSQQVRLAQRLLNRRHRVSPPLVEDSIFGPRTEAAVQHFQKSNRLTADSIVGPRTWAALGVNLDVTHRVQLYAQPTDMSCWSAAATMLTGNRMSFGPGAAALSPSGGLNPSFANIEAFANSHHLRMQPPQSWTVAGIAGLLKSGTIWVAGWIPSGHAVVYGGIHGDGTPEGTMIDIYDPWPPMIGAIYGELYGDWMQKHPMATAYILQAR